MQISSFKNSNKDSSKHLNKHSNWLVKIISLSIALFLWYYVYHTLNRSRQELILGIKFDNIPTNLYTDFNFKNKKAMIIVKGKKESVKEFLSNVEHIKCLVDLTNAHTGFGKYKIKLGKNLELRTLLTKVNITFKKKFVAINFEKISRKKVAIVGNVLGPFNSDFRLVNTVYEPKHIIIEGPFSKINAIDSVKAENYVIKTKKYNTVIKDKVKLEKLAPYIKNISNVKEANIHITMYVGLKKYTVTNIQIISMGNIFSGLGVKEKNLSLDYIIYKGPPDIVGKFKSDNIKAYINISSFSKPGKYTVNTIPQEKKGVSIVDYSPKKLSVTLVKRNIKALNE